jgi:hypothetical protein
MFAFVDCADTYVAANTAALMILDALIFSFLLSCLDLAECVDVR